MSRTLAAVLVVTACAASARAQMAPPPADGPVLTLSQALALAGADAPDLDAAAAAIHSAAAERRVAALRPNPSLSADIENVGVSRTFETIEAPKQTVNLSLPVELGGKRGARIAVADAHARRADIDRGAAEADLRLAVTTAYVEAAAADRRLAIAREQATFAGEGARAARVRVRSGRASPLEQQRAEVQRANAEAAVERSARLADLARDNLARRIGRAVAGPLDGEWFGAVDALPSRPGADRTAIALAAARSDEATAAAQVRLARSQRMPDLVLSAGARRVPMIGETGAVFGVTVPIPLFNRGQSAVEQAQADRERAAAQVRAAEREVQQAIAQAEVDLANAAASARVAAGPALDAAQEAARIARIGYREGKFGQLDLLDAERTLAETRTAAIDALAACHTARARLERLTAAAPSSMDDNR